VKPKDRERYSSRAVDSRTSGANRVMIRVGLAMRGMASRIIQAAVTGVHFVSCRFRS
jgi:hypothetical protein